MAFAFDMTEFTILGAGVAGLTLSVALAQRGHRVRVIEAASEIAQVGVGIQISPNAMRVLAKLGLGDLVARGVEAKGVDVYNGQTGRHLARVPVGQGYQFSQRYELIDVLVAALERLST